jgi:ABC-type Fe3+-hydroxamate transport system substrate-binding protein
MVPSWTETLIECGVDVVGRTRFCVHPKGRVGRVHIVGGTKDIDWDKVKSLNADLMILDQEENPKFMADECPIPYCATHVRSVNDVARDLRRISAAAKSDAVADIAKMWEALPTAAAVKIFRAEKFPGVLEWVRKPDDRIDAAGTSIEKFVYLIWNKPWMAVSKKTFIGSVFERLGYGEMMIDFEKPYPEVDLSKFDPRTTLLLFSSEPYPFGKKKNLIEPLPFASALVDGESFSWFGLRSLRFLEDRLHH